MRRFLWPRTKKDFPYCSAFLAGFQLDEESVQYTSLPTTKRLSERVTIWLFGWVIGYKTKRIKDKNNKELG